MRHTNATECQRFGTLDEAMRAISEKPGAWRIYWSLHTVWKGDWSLEMAPHTGEEDGPPEA